MVKKFINWLCRKGIERTYYHYLNGDITSEEAEERRFFWQTMRAKWVKDQCHHLCHFCQYKLECWTNAKEW
jgi:hypothetical protein